MRAALMEATRWGSVAGSSCCVFAIELNAVTAPLGANADWVPNGLSHHAYAPRRAASDRVFVPGTEHTVRTPAVLKAR